MSDVMDAVENNKAGKGRRQVQQWGVCVCVRGGTGRDITV